MAGVLLNSIELKTVNKQTPERRQETQRGTRNCLAATSRRNIMLYPALPRRKEVRLDGKVEGLQRRLSGGGACHAWQMHCHSVGLQALECRRMFYETSLRAADPHSVTAAGFGEAAPLMLPRGLFFFFFSNYRVDMFRFSISKPPLSVYCTFCRCNADISALKISLYSYQTDINNLEMTYKVIPYFIIPYKVIPLFCSMEFITSSSYHLIILHFSVRQVWFCHCFWTFFAFFRMLAQFFDWSSFM